MTAADHLQAYRRFDELVAAYLARFPDAVDPDAVDDAGIDDMAVDLERGLARGEPIAYLFAPSDSIVRELRKGRW